MVLQCIIIVIVSVWSDAQALVRIHAQQFVYKVHRLDRHAMGILNLLIQYLLEDHELLVTFPGHLAN